MHILLYILRLGTVIIFFLLPNKLFSQEHQHYFGLRGGYSISSIGFEPNQGEIKSVSGIDFGVAYKLYAERFMGAQMELNFVNKGYKQDDTTYTGRAIELPVMAQGFIRFGGFRVFVNGGFFCSYMLSQDVERPDDSGNLYKESYSFSDRDKRFEYGLVGGGGLAFQLKKIELQVDVRYQYSLGYSMKPRYRDEQTIFSHRNNLAFSIALFYNL